MPFILRGIGLLLLSGVSASLLDTAFETYWVVAKLMVGLTTVTALTRIAINNLTLGSYGNLKVILKDTIKFILFIAILPSVIRASLQFSDLASHQLNSPAQVSKLKIEAEHELADEPAGWSLVKAKFGDWYKWGAKFVAVSIAETLGYLRNMILAVLIASSPLFLFLGIMLGMNFFYQSILSLGVSLLIWPILSAILMRFSIMVFDVRGESSWTAMSQATALLIYSFAQLLLPFLTLGAGIRAASGVFSLLSQTAGAAKNTAGFIGSGARSAVTHLKGPS